MAEGKKSVLLYCDLIHTIEKMDNETAGQFFKHYLRYINDKHPETDNPLVDITFESVKQNLKRDLKKWEVRAEKSRENGKKGGRPKTQETQQVISEPRKPVTDTVTVTGNVKETVKVKVKDKETSILLCSIQNESELNKLEDQISFAFWKLFKKDKSDLGITKTVNLDKAKLNDWSRHIRLAIENDKRTKDEFTEVFNFLKNDEWWKGKVQSTEKLRKQMEQLLEKSRFNNKDKKTKNELSPEYMDRLAKKLKS